ncbi:MAG: tRNA uridine-5-carboxymethylaminomethyl(34) synthesis GTPase MnmE [Bacilli bacterium]|nr:tRNA uridine-5-carboxymethylaminomethyl(34) synthesis GTPase MnmE [Bacilli bacterium]
MNDTIAAISTALGVGAISIIRVSGNDAINIVNKIYKGKDLNKVSSHTINYGHIIDMNNIIDEVLVSVFRAPKTFTCEDIVEINSHGGIATTNKILELLLTNGCRLAEPGEFTKRAYLNGRIDLIEAEGVMDLINAKTEKARSLAMNQLTGSVSNIIKKFRDDILDILANIEVNIDYPEYEDIKEYTISDLKEKISYIENKALDILRKSENGKIIKDGINVAILGRPNVGKSSLLNTLLEEDKAIVTDIEGTTRDFVEGTYNLDGIVLNFIDTAGIRDTDDIVEKIGVSKSLSLLDKSDLILYILNNNEEITDYDINLLDKIKNKKHICIVNKCDLDNKLDLSNLSNYIKISTKNKEGIDLLLKKIKELFNLELLEKDDLTYLSNARCISILKEIITVIDSIKNGININMPIDIIEIDIKKVWELLGSIIGESYEDELINKLFSQFCLGK